MWVSRVRYSKFGKGVPILQQNKFGRIQCRTSLIWSHFILELVKILYPWISINLLKTRNPRAGTLANSEDPDEMPHYAAISSGSALFA